MSWETWVAYAVATELILLVPGPTVLLVVSYALTRGAGPALWAVAGSCLGTTVAFAIAFGGLGALLAASSTAFTIMKWIGAAYLIYLGVSMWRARADNPLTALTRQGAASEPEEKRTQEGPGKKQRSTFWHGFITTLLNPKVAVFLVAFIPQFLDPSRQTAPQALIMTATFVGLAFVSDGAYVLLASRARKTFLGPRGLKWTQRLAGSLLIGAGLVTAAAKRSG